MQPGNIIRNKHSDSAKQFSETDITKMLEVSIDSIFGGSPFEQTVDSSTVLWVQTALFCTPSCSVIRIWRRVSDKKQELHTFREYLSSSPVFWWGLFSFFMLSYYVSLRSEFHVVKSYSSYRKECTQV